eukprot:15452157-Alexandrium_andersonii.AAC.1
MQATVDFDKALLYVPSISSKPIKLVVAPNGHFLLPLFNFKNRAISQYMHMGQLSATTTESGPS